MKLNLGCGENYREGWINIDGDPKIKADYHWSILDHASLSQYKGQCEQVDAWQCLEHLEIWDTQPALSLWLDLLAVDGIIEIIVPDFEFVAHSWLTLPKDELWFNNWWQMAVFGLAQIGFGDLQRHRQLFTYDRLTRYVQMAFNSHNPEKRFEIYDFPDNIDFSDNSLHCRIRRIA